MAQAFAAMLRQHRLRCRLTQEALAERAGVSSRSIREMEGGRRRSPRPNTTTRLADALELSGSARAEFIQAGQTLFWDSRAGAPGSTDQTDQTEHEALVPEPAFVVPRQLPADVGFFTGRTHILQQLDALLPEPDAAGAAVTIAAVSGTAGAGKTALTVYWAHRVADCFPDGQLYANLRGFDQAGEVMTPEQAVRGFLAALGVPPERVPPDLDAQAALYRSLLAGRRVLVVLDNARDAGHVRALLPGTPNCLAVVTSRNQLTSLVAAQGALPLRLDVLSAGESAQLLAQRLGQQRMVAEPAAVEQIVNACARLPLALTIAAARAQQTSFPLAEMAKQLSRADGLLEALDAGDITTQVRAVFSWSYATLPPAVARMFRLLGLQPGPDISAAAAASLAGHPPAEAVRLLTELTRANLLVEHAPARYAFHDLLHAYAAELAQAHDPERDREAAMTRLLDHYAHTACAAAILLDPRLDPSPVPLEPPKAGSRPESLADREQARAWLSAESAVLLATVRHTTAAELDQYTCQLAWAIRLFLDRSGHWHDLSTVAADVQHAAQRMGSPTVEGFALRLSARTEIRLGRFARARSDLERALELYARAGDQSGVAHTHTDLSQVVQRQGHYAEAIEHIARSLDAHRSIGNLLGVAAALNSLGYCQALAGDHKAALEHCTQALIVFQQIDDSGAIALTWHSIGYAHHRAGEHAEAAECYQESVRLLRVQGDQYNSATVLTHLGDAYQAAGDGKAAQEAWRAALAMLIDLRHPDVDAVRAKLQPALDPAARDRAS